MYLFVYVIVKAMIWGDMFRLQLLNELVDMPWQVSAVCTVLIFFKDEESVGIDYCLNKMFVCLMDTLWTFVKWDL